MNARAKAYEVEDDIEAVFDYTYQKGWTDGLPVVPATPARVERMLATVDRKPEEIIAHLAPARLDATVEKVAVCAVMAGCRPEYFPAVLASVEAAGDPAYELYGVNTTTNPTVPMIIMNGPARISLDVNCSWGVLGPYKRANATIGRALSLAMINLAGRIPEVACKGTWKNPGGFTMCAGEYEEESPYEPLHVERGFAKEDSTVTLMTPASCFNIVDTESQTAEELLQNICAGMLGAGGNNIFPFYGLGEYAIMLSPGHAKVLATGFTKQQIREFLLEHLKIPVSYVSPRRVKMMEAAGHGQIENGFVRYAAHAWQFLIFVAGGLGGYHSAGFTTFGDSRPITRKFTPVG